MAEQRLAGGGRRGLLTGVALWEVLEYEPAEAHRALIHRWVMQQEFVAAIEGLARFDADLARWVLLELGKPMFRFLTTESDDLAQGFMQLHSAVIRGQRPASFAPLRQVDWPSFSIANRVNTLIVDLRDSYRRDRWAGPTLGSLSLGRGLARAFATSNGGDTSSYAFSQSVTKRTAEFFEMRVPLIARAALTFPRRSFPKRF